MTPSLLKDYRGFLHIPQCSDGIIIKNLEELRKILFPKVSVFYLESATIVLPAFELFRVNV